MGLRTLYFASREISKDIYKDWVNARDEARKATENKEEKMEKAHQILESDMQLMGITAIKDNLQVEVPETIDFLKEAGIKFWVITGDKVETTVNVARQAGLISKSDTYFMHCQMESFDLPIDGNENESYLFNSTKMQQKIDKLEKKNKKLKEKLNEAGSRRRDSYGSAHDHYHHNDNFSDVDSVADIEKQQLKPAEAKKFKKWFGMQVIDDDEEPLPVIRIIDAYYGNEEVSDKIKKMYKKGIRSFEPSSDIFGVPESEIERTLDCCFEYNGIEELKEVREFSG